MPGRTLPIVTGELYHIVNRGVEHRPTFVNKKDYQRAIQTMEFYRFVSPGIKLSRFLLFSKSKREKFLENLKKKKQKLTELICFCLMPNHFHFLLKQTKDNGISKFMSNFQNSFTRYFNTKNERIGSLFQGQFKAVRVETDQQFLHLSRYIHLNPYSSFVIKSLGGLLNYPWSSFPDYLGKEKEGLCQKDVVLAFFKSGQDYKKFVFDQADYQRELEIIKHLILEK